MFGHISGVSHIWNTYGEIYQGSPMYETYLVRQSRYLPYQKHIWWDVSGISCVWIMFGEIYQESPISETCTVRNFRELLRAKQNCDSYGDRGCHWNTEFLCFVTVVLVVQFPKFHLHFKHQAVPSLRLLYFEVEGTVSFETSETTYWTVQSHIPEDFNFKQHWCEYLIPHTRLHCFSYHSVHLNVWLTIISVVTVVRKFEISWDYNAQNYSVCFWLNITDKDSGVLHCAAVSVG